MSATLSSTVSRSTNWAIEGLVNKDFLIKISNSHHFVHIYVLIGTILVHTSSFQIDETKLESIAWVFSTQILNKLIELVFGLKVSRIKIQLKTVHFKNTVARSTVLSKLCVIKMNGL